jgi:hypothetical protein
LIRGDIFHRSIHILTELCEKAEKNGEAGVCADITLFTTYRIRVAPISILQRRSGMQETERRQLPQTQKRNIIYIHPGYYYMYI